MTSNSQNNSPNHPQNDRRDDEVLAQLFKKGAMETPPAKLNSKIINYAANPDKSIVTPTSVGSHFGGGWKVPLSMAASVVVVFALLVQLDQTPQQLELPPIPEISTPTEHNEELLEADEAFADDASSFKNDKKESGLGSQSSDTIITDTPADIEPQSSTNEIQAIPSTNNKSAISKPSINKNIDSNTEEKARISRERTQIQQQSTITPPAPTTSPSTTSTKAKVEDGYAAPIPEKLAKPQAAKKQMQAPVQESLNNNALDAASGAAMQEKSLHKRQDGGNTSDMAAEAESTEDLANEPDSASAQTEAEFAPIPVEDWLLMIEKLVAQKDYAEAARQLTKFKQAHPKVNVEDLDARIP